jgi:preprotein translocase subunit SecF
MSSLGFGSLDELWGDNFTAIDGINGGNSRTETVDGVGNANNYNEQTGIDYTGGNKFQTELAPITNNNESLMLANQNNQQHQLVVPQNQSQQLASISNNNMVSRNVVAEESKNIREILSKIDERIKKLEEMCVKRDKQVMEGFSNRTSNYFDLLVLVGLGILIIYVLDSVMKMGRN